jgi:hypothetical protein
MERVRWMRMQVAHTAAIGRSHGLKAALGDRLAAAIAKAPQMTTRLMDLDANLAAAKKAVRRLERQALSDREHMDAELAAARAAVALSDRQLTALTAELEALRVRQSDARSAILEWIWFANAPLAAHPLITVILPTAHPERLEFLRSALDSVIGQTYSNWEVVVADDGHGPVLDPLPPWWPGDERIRVIRSEARNSGGARNAALADARGEVIAYLDDDCRWFPWWLHAVAAAYTEDPALEVAYGVRIVEGPPGQLPEAWATPLEPLVLHFVNPVDTNVLTHRSGLADMGWSTDASCNDFELGVRFVGRRTRHLPVPAVDYGTRSPARIWSPERVEGNMPRYRDVLRAARTARPLRVVATGSFLLGDVGVLDELDALVSNGVDLVVADDRSAGTSRALLDVPWYVSVDEAAERHDPDIVLAYASPTVPFGLTAGAAASVPWAVRVRRVGSISSISSLDDRCTAVFHVPSTEIQHAVGVALDAIVADPGPICDVDRDGPLTVSASGAWTAEELHLIAELDDAVHDHEVGVVLDGFDAGGDLTVPDDRWWGLLSPTSIRTRHKFIRRSSAVVCLSPDDHLLDQPWSALVGAALGIPVVLPASAGIRDFFGDAAHYYQRGSTQSMVEVVAQARADHTKVADRVQLSRRVRDRFCDPGAGEAWALSLTRSLVAWQLRHRHDPTSAAQRWWQPA